MKRLFTLSLVTLLGWTIIGCTSGYCDSGAGDSVCKGSYGGGTPKIDRWDVSCNGGSCTWTVGATAELGVVQLDLTETGDPTYECGPGKDLNDCGVWHEYHDRFTLTSSGSSYEAKSITLDVVDDYTQQVNNSTTLFDTQGELNQLTVLWVITDSSGNYADCGVAGEMTSYYSSECSNLLSSN